MARVCLFIPSKMRSISATGDFQFQDGFGDNFSTSFASLFDPVSEAPFGDDSRTPDIASFCPRARRASQSEAKRKCQEKCSASLDASSRWALWGLTRISVNVDKCSVMDGFFLRCFDIGFRSSCNRLVFRESSLAARLALARARSLGR